ncbi:MAG: 2-amino-4-hydroxy-6-hydroxymethyldihydropteridine diphosphokinase [Methyloversatilis sp.]|jgi:2-amino-4-hydroxy-6-hydroxymethyldihydropteridine diphosphokinase|uniref:2-amino-4-hydroxy-6- hydroxymethyldihydropteridine diphosphokinase n=1 Tax=Methyloversatilis TaxID=378210 RepID=UPI000369FE7B|nr:MULTISPECIES: 2-amino-4-hydroxy-6-hydroxymethyldihydropteridine diphosphokinase [Methyloversatilis]MCR6667166.1 2-amino-4-hydroxy-6-hydroxymethyldihydropteridine diphosphokinase [Methyloversatilis sp.]
MSQEAPTHIAHIGLGANLADPEKQVRAALDELAAAPGIVLERKSSLYRTAPIGYDNQPDFINAVARVRTTLEPQALLDALLEIERTHGRVREFLNAPRTLDLDVLLYEDRVINTDTLNVPHPRAHLRAFVLLPLLEVSPDVIIPGIGPASAWLAHCQDQPIQRIAD